MALTTVTASEKTLETQRIVYLVRLISIWYCKWFMLKFHDTGHA
jgi:hypothetical protein